MRDGTLEAAKELGYYRARKVAFRVWSRKWRNHREEPHGRFDSRRVAEMAAAGPAATRTLHDAIEQVCGMVQARRADDERKYGPAAE